MYTIGDEVKVPANPVRWPSYPDGFTGQIMRLESFPSYPGEVWAMVAVIVGGRAQEARLVPLPLNLPVLSKPEPEPRPDDVRHGPPPGFKRLDLRS